MLFSAPSVPSEWVLKANALKIWLNDNPDSFLEGEGAGDFSSIVSLSVEPLQLFLFGFKLSLSAEFSLVNEWFAFRLFENSLCGATGDGGGVGSILRLLGSAGRPSSGLEAVVEPLSLRLPSLLHRIVRAPSPAGTEGNLRLAFGLLPGEPGGLREICPEE